MTNLHLVCSIANDVDIHCHSGKFLIILFYFYQSNMENTLGYGPGYFSLKWRFSVTYHPYDILRGNRKGLEHIEICLGRSQS